MIRSYINIALRNFRKHSLTSFINLSGLTIGLTCCMLILVYILHELSYDRYNRNADRTYRVTRLFNGPNGSVALNLSAVAPPVGPLLQNDFPDIQAMTRMLPNGSVPMRYGEKKFSETRSFFADENFPKVFDITMVEGSAVNSLKDPFHMMISEEEASKYFDGEDPIGKVIRIDDQFDFKVSGVYRSFPSNAHMHPDMLLSFVTLNNPGIYGEEGLRTNWGNNAFPTYLLMPPHYPVAAMEAKFPAFLDQHMGAQYSGTTKPSAGTSLHLQKLTDIHLRSHLDDELEENGDIDKIYIFGAIALFILLIACINYMNLSTARSALRAREIGIRKTIGARRQELIAQFLSESVLITLVALLLSLALTRLVLPYMGQLSGRELSIHELAPWQVWLPLSLLPIVVGVLSGLYPALFLSSFKPVKVLKGIIRANGSDLSFRKVLVVLQFSISIGLIVCTGVVLQQVRFIRNKPLGYNKDHLLVLHYQSELDKSFESFRTQLLGNNLVLNIARSSRIPTGRLLDDRGLSVPSNGKMQPVVNADMKYVAADQDFVSTYGISMAAGRNFSRDFPTDTSGFLINESALPVLGCASASEAIGKDLKYGDQEGKVIGVMKDINFESLHQKITPLILVYPTSHGGGFGRMTVRLSGSDTRTALAHVEATWKKFMPEKPFDYTFLDDNFDQLYKSETRQEQIFSLFAGIAIFIACLGLLGLSAFTISQRIKEIGIRKVLGAGTGSIVQLISGDFLKLVVIAALIAFPIAWYAMHQWLGGFAYRAPMGWWVFVLAAGIALIVAFVTIGIQTLKAASANPIKHLRSE